MVNNVKYIEKVILENFQSHKNSIIEFNNQLNVIIGPSDSGKTAILRGIKWALYNEPSGDYFIREGQMECSVTIIFNDKTKIKRYRSKTKNIYYIYDSDNNETKFEGFGTSVPQEIIDKTGIEKILLDSNESKAINLSDQLEGPFLLSEKGSTRANSIGRLVGVNIIDDSLREALKDSRNLSQRKKVIDDSILKLENELKEYDYLMELSKSIDEIEIIRNKIYNNSKLMNKYKELLDKLLEISKTKTEATYYIEKLKEIDSVNIILKDVSHNIDKYKYFNKKLSQLNKLKTNIEYNTNIISSLYHIELANKTIENVNLSYDKIVELERLKNKLIKIKLESDKISIVSQRLIYLEDIQSGVNNITIKLKQLEKLVEMEVREKALRKSLEFGNIYMKRLKGIDTAYDIQNLIRSKIELLDKLEAINKKSLINTKEIVEETTKINEFTRSLELNLESYKSLLLKRETCPLCFSNINEEKINHIIEHYN